MKNVEINWVLVTLPFLLLSCGPGSEAPATGMRPPTSGAPTEQVEPGEITDQQLVEDSQQPGYTFYLGDPRRIPFTPGGGGHGGTIRVRFNPIAESALGQDGKLPQGASFPPGSVVVKELYDDNSGPMKGFAVIRKAPNATNAASGWVWGESTASGVPLPSTSTQNRGDSCVSCHSLTAETSPVPGDTGNRDLIRTFGIR